MQFVRLDCPRSQLSFQCRNFTTAPCIQQGCGNSVSTKGLQATGGTKEVPTGTCPECEADVHVDTEADKGDTVACSECGTELEVVGLDPVELDIVEDDDAEDDDDDEEY